MQHGPGGRAVAADGALALLVTGAAFAPFLAHHGVELSDLPARPTDALGVALALGQGLPLVWRRAAPAACLVLVAGSFALYQALGYDALFAGLGLLVALHAAGAHLARARTAAAVASAGAYVVLAVVLHALGSPERVTDFAAFACVLAACWAVGAASRARADRAAAREAGRRAEERSEAVAAERSRIARELHDVVTHHVTAMVVQADAASFQVERPELVGAALGRIAGSGRQALAELRHQLGVLAGPDAGPDRAPAVEGVGALVARVAAAGHPVELVERGEGGELGAAVALAVHRVVQESLTNALKHAPGRPTTVVVARSPGRVDVEVTSAHAPGAARGAGRAGAAPVGPVRAAAAGSGRGLVGLAERVGLLGGDLSAGPRADGSFAVSARIPVPSP